MMMMILPPAQWSLVGCIRAMMLVLEVQRIKSTLFCAVLCTTVRHTAHVISSYTVYGCFLSLFLCF